MFFVCAATFFILVYFYTSLHRKYRQIIDKQNYKIARYQYTGKYLGV